MTDNVGIPEHVVQKIQAAVNERRLESRRRMLQESALLHGICPSCGGAVKEREEGFLFKTRVGYDCSGCGVFHPFRLGE